ncbi:MAG: PKD domain-containing protein [Acidobacteriota bacterium]
MLKRGVLALLIWLASVPVVAKNCDLTQTGAVPLPDLGPGLYKGFSGGLYPGGTDAPPSAHLQAGVAIAQNIQPLDLAGNPDPAGKIVLISIGMSNAAQEFYAGANSFISKLAGDPSLNPQLAIVNCAEPGRTVEYWLDPEDPVYSDCEASLAAEGLSVSQVQAAWIKQAEPGGGCCSGAFPDHALYQKDRLAQMIRVVKGKFPKLVIAHLSGRTRAYEDNPNALNPEPIAYETSFAVKWLIEDQLDGAPGLNFDPARGTVVAPWLAWGPYLWVDGLQPRSDGLTWVCDDTAPDGIHPSQSGVDKVSEQLIAFYKTDLTAKPWFLQPPQGLSIRIESEVLSTDPRRVSFRGVATGWVPSEFDWSFGDGLSTRSASPVKTYPVAGSYSVVLTARDAAGNGASAQMTLTVSSTRPVPPSNLRVTSVTSP